MEPIKYRKMKKLFLRQSYLDSWDDYQRSLNKRNFVKWDYIILTASNEEQAVTYRQQLQYRIDNQLLPENIRYVVLADPDGKRVGSGGATFNVIKYIADDILESSVNCFQNKRILVIHSGGDSKRVPQYSACGKLFSPVPRELPNGEASTLFDEFIIGMSGVPSRIKEGMLVLSGDVLLLFNPLQIDSQFHGAAAISIKEQVETGKNHGVFLNDGHECVERFLHKQSEEKLRELGAVDDQGFVDLDTGAILLDSNILFALFMLISTDNKSDSSKFSKFVNEKAKISFYGDFLYPLAIKSTLEQYYKEAAEGTICDELIACRTALWSVLHEFKMKLICLSPAEFIHFGTTKELLELVTETIDDYEFLDWKRLVVTNFEKQVHYAVHNSLVMGKAVIGSGSYIEDSYLYEGTTIGEGSVISNLALYGETIPEGVVLHGLCLQGGHQVTRIYGINDNPKGTLSNNASFLQTTLKRFLEKNHLEKFDLWADEPDYLWFANLYPICKSMKDALKYSLILYKMAQGKASEEDVADWKAKDRVSLFSSFNLAAVQAIVPWRKELENQILVEKFLEKIFAGEYYKTAMSVFGQSGCNKEQYRLLMKIADQSNFANKIRIYYDMSRIMKIDNFKFDGNDYEKLESQCFDTIQKEVFENATKNMKDNSKYCIAKDLVDVRLPVRVNWGGGWTDTPPYCIENGGVVINSAIKLRGKLPIHVMVKKLEKYHVEFESQDIGAYGEFDDALSIQDCHNPYDSFALHKAALIACGIIPIKEKCDLYQVLKKLGGGIYLSTEAMGVPQGSGLGTSSILAGACVKGIFEFLGEEISDDELYERVLSMEQIMSTGGGWQDQVGGLTAGIKYITTKPGLDQKIKVEHLIIPEVTIQELQERYVLIYTGQRRLARNILRDVVGNYIGATPESLDALYRMQRIAALMKFELERGNTDAFAELMNEHWVISKQLDAGSTNTCIDQIFLSCEDLLDAKFICGAGGGGFLQVILKKGISKEQLRRRLRGVFQNSGVDVWECELIL